MEGPKLITGCAVLQAIQSTMFFYSFSLRALCAVDVDFWLFKSLLHCLHPDKRVTRAHAADLQPCLKSSFSQHLIKQKWQAIIAGRAPWKTLESLSSFIPAAGWDGCCSPGASPVPCPSSPELLQLWAFTVRSGQQPLPRPRAGWKNRAVLPHKLCIKYCE